MRPLVMKGLKEKAVLIRCECRAMPSFRFLVVMHFEMRDEYCSMAEMKSAGSMSGGGLITTRTEHRE